jgi:radical SAM protein with 4Fe4S-binding SPASM domain
VSIFGGRHLPLLYTNGWYVDAAGAKALFDAGLACASVSIDYPDRRHDQKRGLPGAFDRAWRAVELFKEAAPRGGKQVRVITVLTDDNAEDLEDLLEMSQAAGVGHDVTLLATRGFRRGKAGDKMPARPMSAELAQLWRRYPHLAAWRDYLDLIDAFREGRPMPTCRAGQQSFNIDHVGNVSACIEKIDRALGNVRDEPLTRIHARMKSDGAWVEQCQVCWTLCRGTCQVLGGGGGPRAWLDLMTRVRAG